MVSASAAARARRAAAAAASISASPPARRRRPTAPSESRPTIRIVGLDSDGAVGRLRLAGGDAEIEAAAAAARRALAAALAETTARDLARAVGVSPRQITRWLSGQRLPSLVAAVRLARLVPGCTPDAWLDE